MAAKLPRESARRNAEVKRREAILDMVGESIEASGDGNQWRLEGHSMGPILRPGDRLTAISIPVPKVGDLLLFKAGSELVCHRVIALEPLLLAGDNNQRLDRASPDDLLGQVVSARRGGRLLPLDRGLLAATAPMIARWHRLGRDLLHGSDSPSGPEASRILGLISGRIVELARMAFLRALALAWLFAKR